MKHKIYILIILILVMLVSNVAFADEKPEENLSSLNEAVRENRNISNLLDPEGKAVIFGLSRDLFNIARYIVITAILVRGIWLFIDFSNAGDNPQKISQIKSQIIWLSLGIIFSINFWQIYGFATNVVTNIRLL